MELSPNKCSFNGYFITWNLEQILSQHHVLISDMKFEMEKGKGRGMAEQSRAAAHKKRSISLCIGGGRELFTRNRRRTEGRGRERWCDVWLEFRKMSQVRRPIIIGEFPEVTTIITVRFEDLHD